ncbi:MAG: ferritin family protein, partial [Candidatus Limiplasma sp.]|nr:ferritin family protein [Candidatus Limiplasma sp.]
MQVKSTQEALFIACEMERGAVQLYERALMLLGEQKREGEPLRAQLAYMLGDEKQHLAQFRELYTGLDAEMERTLTLAAIASEVLFPGGLMGAVRAGLLKDERSMLAFAADAEQKAAATYRAFAAQSEDPRAAEMLNGSALEEDKHLRTLQEHQAALEA